MSSETKNLAISLFCLKDFWHLALNKGIGFFLQTYTKEIVSSTIEFNYLCGENIRLTIACENKDAEIIALKADQYFKSFFLKNNFPVKPIRLPVDGMFLPCPSNTIQYGLYKAIPPGIFSSELSTLILDILSEEEVDNENIITFAFYLQLGLVRIQGALQQATGYFPIEEQSELTNEFLKEKYDSSQLLFQEICLDVLYQDRTTIKRDMPWLDRWLSLCEIQLSKGNSFSSLVYIIYRHLGLTENMKSMLNYFISSVMAGNLKVNN